MNEMMIQVVKTTFAFESLGLCAVVHPLPRLSQRRQPFVAQVVELKQALEGVRNLPAVKEARAESAARLLDLEKQREFYGKEIEKLRTDVEEAKQEEQSSRLELTTQIEGAALQAVICRLTENGVSQGCSAHRFSCKWLQEKLVFQRSHDAWV